MAGTPSRFRWRSAELSTEARFPAGRRLAAYAGVFILVFLPAVYIDLPGTASGTAGVLVAAVLAGWLLLAVDGRGRAALGFHGPVRASLRESALGLALGVGVGLGAVALMVAGGALRWSGGDPAGLLVAALASLWFFLIPAAAEEALFRGYPFQAAVRAWGAWPALLGFAALFGALHLANPDASAFGVVNIAAAGVFLGVLYLRTASLWWPTGAHLGWNWSHGFVADLPVSGYDVVGNPALEAHLSGPAWLSGGGFGPEGSVAGAVALVAATAWCFKSDRLGVSHHAAPDRLIPAPEGAELIEDVER